MEAGWGGGDEDYELTPRKGSEPCLAQSKLYVLTIILLLCHFRVPTTNTNNDSWKIQTLMLTGEQIISAIELSLE